MTPYTEHLALCLDYDNLGACGKLDRWGGGLHEVRWMRQGVGRLSHGVEGFALLWVKRPTPQINGFDVVVVTGGELTGTVNDGVGRRRKSGPATLSRLGTTSGSVWHSTLLLYDTPGSLRRGLSALRLATGEGL